MTTAPSRGLHHTTSSGRGRWL